MVLSPWEANRFAASQEIPHISRNPKAHYRTHNRPPPVSILGQPNPVHIPTSHLLEIHPNIIHPSTPRSPQLSPSPRFPHQDPIHPPLLTHTRHMHRQCNYLMLFHDNSGYANAPQYYIIRLVYNRSQFFRRAVTAEAWVRFLSYLWRMKCYYDGVFPCQWRFTSAVFISFSFESAVRQC